MDSQGLPHAIVVTTANVTDGQGALMAIKQNSGRLSGVSSLLVDGGYTGHPFVGVFSSATEMLNRFLGLICKQSMKIVVQVIIVTVKFYTIVLRSFFACYLTF